MFYFGKRRGKHKKRPKGLGENKRALVEVKYIQDKPDRKHKSQFAPVPACPGG
jgi:hypothetical protein